MAVTKDQLNQIAADAVDIVRGDMQATASDATAVIRGDMQATAADAVDIIRGDSQTIAKKTRKHVRKDMQATAADAVDVIRGDMQSTASDVTDVVRGDMQATAADAVDILRAVREEGDRTRAAIIDDGPLARPWNWVVGAVVGFIAFWVVIFMVKIAQFGITAKLQDLNFLNYTCNADNVKIPMADSPATFFSSAFWYSGEGYWMGLSKTTHDATAPLFAVIIAISLVVAITTAICVSILTRRRSARH